MKNYLSMYEKFRNRLGRQLSEKEKVFVQWVSAQHLLEQKVKNHSYDPQC